MSDFAINKLSDLQKASDPALTILELDPADIKCLKQVRGKESEGAKSEAIAELAESMRHEGQHEPVIVRPNPDKNGLRYIMVAGERRLKAARMIGSFKIKAIVKDVSEEEARRIQISENIHRTNLTQMEVAKAVKEDMARLGSLAKVAEVWNKSLQWVSQQMKFIDAASGQGPAAEAIKSNITSDREAITNLGKLQDINVDKAKEVLNQLKNEQKSGAKSNVRETVNKALKEEKGKLPAKKEGQGKPASEAKGKEDLGHDSKFQVETYGKWIMDGLKRKKLNDSTYEITVLPFMLCNGRPIVVEVQFVDGYFYLGSIVPDFKPNALAVFNKTLSDYGDIMYSNGVRKIKVAQEEFAPAFHEFVLALWNLDRMSAYEK